MASCSVRGDFMTQMYANCSRVSRIYLKALKPFATTASVRAGIKKTCDLRRGDLSIVSGVSAMDDPKQLISRFVEELWNERRLDVADAIFAKDCVTHQLRSGVPADAVPS